MQSIGFANFIFFKRKILCYYAGNAKLRSWIGIPLTMGIFDPKEQTLKALFSPYLWTKDGMLSEAGSAVLFMRVIQTAR